MAWAGYAARRAQGLCVLCRMPSVRYARCLSCRLEWRAAQRKAERTYWRTHRDVINARRRKTQRRSPRKAQWRIASWRYRMKQAA